MPFQHDNHNFHPSLLALGFSEYRSLGFYYGDDSYHAAYTIAVLAGVATLFFDESA